METLEERKQLVAQLNQEYALFAVEAPAYAASLWTAEQIEAYFESDGQITAELPGPRHEEAPALAPDAPGWEDLKARGNESFKKQQFRDADRLYSAALEELTSPSDVVTRIALLNNRSAARTRLERYEEAAADARMAAAASKGSDPKALFRLGEALSGMGQCKDAEEAFGKAAALKPDDASIANRLKEATLEAAEAAGGGLIVEQLLSGRDLCVNPTEPSHHQIFQTGAQMANFEYLIVDPASRECVVVDPAWDVKGLLKIARQRDLTIKGAIITHWHIDHCGGAAPAPFPPALVEGAQTLVESSPTPVVGLGAALGKQARRQPNAAYASPHPTSRACLMGSGASGQTSAKVSSIVRTGDNDTVQIGKHSVKLLHTPGHTAGSQCIQVGNSRLITGDTLFVGSCGRTDMEDSDVSAMYHSLHRLGGLPDEICVMPGHNYDSLPSTLLKDAKRNNNVLMAAMSTPHAWNRAWGR